MTDKRFPAADAHCDFLYGMSFHDYDINTEKQHIQLEKMIQGNVKLQFFAAWVDMNLDINPLSQCLNMIDSYYRMLEGNPVFTPFTKDFDPSGDKIGTVLTVEGGEAIERSPANLRILHKLGVRAMTLTWNYPNSLAYPATGKHAAKKGLTDLGKEIIKEMNRIGIAVDVSHLNDAGIDDILGLSTRPIFASHSNARSVYSHPRCLKDEHIKAIAQQGGVIGVNFFYKQLTDRREATLNDVIRHVEHILNLCGPDCVAFGSDLDGMNLYPKGLSNSAGFTLIAEALHTIGLNDEDIYKVMYKNLADYISKFI